MTLPHSSEGIEKRRDAISLLKELEKYTEGIIVVDYETLPCSTFSELYEEGDRRMIEIIYEFFTDERNEEKWYVFWNSWL